MILPGVHIGDGAIIGANSVVGSDLDTVREDMPWVEQEFDPELRQYILDFPKDHIGQKEQPPQREKIAASGKPGAADQGLFDRLSAEGYLTEQTSETDDLLCRPAPAGVAVGITLTERTGKDGRSFTMVTLTEQARRWLLDHLFNE